MHTLDTPIIVIDHNRFNAEDAFIGYSADTIAAVVLQAAAYLGLEKQQHDTAEKVH